jgi:hypothetical protein
MKHFASPEFWAAYRKLPDAVRNLADKNFTLLKAGPRVYGFFNIDRLTIHKGSSAAKALGLNIISNTRRLWHWLAIFLQAIDMKTDGVADFTFDGGNGCAGRDAAGQVRHIG